MSPIWIITGKEVRDSLRNRWVLAATLLLAALALSLGFLGSSPTGSVKADPLTITVVSLSSLSIFLIPLIYRPASEQHPFGFTQVETGFVVVKGAIMAAVTPLRHLAW